MKIQIRTWWFENLVMLAALALVVLWRDLPVAWKTAGWALGIMVAHTAHSHGLRKAEQAGKPIDWMAEWLVLLGGVAVLLGADASARELVAVPVARQAVFIVWRFSYRRWWKPLVTSWSRADD